MPEKSRSEIVLIGSRASGERTGGQGRALGFALAGLAMMATAGCASRDNLPPVFGAVFGITGAPVRPFTEGRLADPAVGPDSRLVGAAAANPGSCIWQDASGRRFRAACPEGSDGLKPKL